MKKSIIMLTVAATVGLGTTFGGISVKTEAASISSLKGEQNKINEERSGLKSDINQANDKISTLQGQQADVKSEMKRLDYAIGDLTTKINDKTTKIDDTKTQIQVLQAETKVIMERIDKRNVLLKDRARNYQANGGVVNYLDVLMGSTSFSDFVDRANAVATIVQADQDILKQQEADKKELEGKQTQVEQDLASLEKMLADLENMNQQLSAQKAEKDQLLANLVDQEATEHEHTMDLQEQEETLASQEIAIQKVIKQAEATAKAAAEATAKAAAEAAAKVPAKAKSNNATSSGGIAPAPQVSSGSFTRPTVGPVTSGYGYRTYDNSFHNGIDFGSATDSDAIVAAADGVVSRSYNSSSYGQAIFISSIVNGQLYTTVYAHMIDGSRMVQEGDAVKKGQHIGTKGSTGASGGIHLHFELHKGKWENDKRNKINPAGIIPGI
jgi:peptidoglycan hydrolase CwlO-like protein